MATAHDGVTHINVYSKAQTWLGKQLSNFAHRPFEHPEDGKFASVEGYWYWLSCHDEKLRELHGFQAKEYGKKVAKGYFLLPQDVFQQKIKLAVKAKIEQHSGLAKEFRESTLPFKHYYVYGEKIVYAKAHDWIIEYLEELREEMKREVG